MEECGGEDDGYLAGLHLEEEGLVNVGGDAQVVVDVGRVFKLLIYVMSRTEKEGDQEYFNNSDVKEHSNLLLKQ